jgi:hypothetical protein
MQILSGNYGRGIEGNRGMAHLGTHPAGEWEAGKSKRGAIMKNRIATSLFIGLALIAGLLGTASRASAQKGALVTIPFAFEANHQVLPAGDYRVHVLTPRLISLIDRSTGTYKALLLVHPQQEREIETRGRMIFLHGEKQYLLTQIRFEGSNLHADLVVQPSPKRELVKQTPASKSTVEIALR